MCPTTQVKLEASITLTALVFVGFGFLPRLQATDRGGANTSNSAFSLSAVPPTSSNTALDRPQAVAPASPDCVVWDVVPSPNAGSINDQLLSVAAISVNDVWAAGWYYAGDVVLTLTEHWNGTSWTVVSSPNVYTSSELYGITAVASNNVWAVGYSLQNGGSPVGRTLILHWNGTNWTVIPSPNPGAYDNRLYDVRAASANDIWAVGHYSDCYNCPGNTLTEHWNGTSWTVVSSPNPGLSRSLTGIAVITSNEVWAAGDYVPCAGCRVSTLTMRWNGTTWTVVPSPNAGAGDNYINRIAAVPSASNVWAVGFYYQQGNGPLRTLALFWDGSQWSIIATPNGQTGDSSFGGVVGVSAQDVWAVRTTNAVGNVSQSMVQHWNGASWTMFSSQSPGAGRNELNYVAATSAGNLWTVGAYFNTPYNYRTLVERPDYTCGTK